jgi:hypothetical protein
LSQNTRKKIQSEPLRLCVAMILMLLGFAGCTTREAGCLDPNASNFDLNADRACDDCCVLPTLSLLLSQQWDGMIFTVPDTFSDVNQKPFIIRDIRFFLSSWQWKNVAGGTYTIDSIQAPCGTGLLRYPPDIVMIDPKNFTFLIGDITVAPIMDSVLFHVGLTSDFDCLDDLDPATPAILTPSSPLFNPDEGALNAIRLVINRNPADTITDTIFIDLVKPITLAYPYHFMRGTNTQFILTVNYADWFREIDVEQISSFTTSVTNGLAGSFRKT